MFLVTPTLTGHKHPSVVSLFGVAHTSDEVVLVINFVKGSALDKLIFGKFASKIHSHYYHSTLVACNINVPIYNNSCS